MSVSEPAGGPAPVEAIERALTLLSALADSGSAGIYLVDLCRDLDLHKSTAYRALSTMKAQGYVSQDLDGSYRLGSAALALGAHFFGPSSLAQQLRPALVVLSRELAELVHLGILTGDRVVYVDKVEPDKAIRVWSQVGSAVPAATTSLGRAILAYQSIPDDQLDAFCNDRTAAQTLRAAIKLARTRGYATEIEENEPGIACLGVPILANNTAIGALSVTMLAHTLNEGRIAEVASTIAKLLPARLPEGLYLPPELS